MKRIVSVLLLCALAPRVQAQESQAFNISGEILPGVCKVAFPDVDLGWHSAASFTGSHATPYVDFSGTVSDCDPLVLRVAMTFDGNADPDNGDLFQALPGIGIQLVRVVGALNVPLRPAARTQYVSATGIYPFRARLQQSSPNVSAGRIQRAVTVSLTYN
ncbi:fimbrial protein [Stenotrophomonas maltophilia]|uniref:fimbrial protein n=1 Tax=Stenotrophomonas maltophilia TaxID=40324 RepID=UPI0039C126F0